MSHWLCSRYYHATQSFRAHQKYKSYRRHQQPHRSQQESDQIGQQGATYIFLLPMSAYILWEHSLCSHMVKTDASQWMDRTRYHISPLGAENNGGWALFHFLLCPGILLAFKHAVTLSSPTRSIHLGIAIRKTQLSVPKHNSQFQNTALSSKTQLSIRNSQFQNTTFQRRSQNTAFTVHDVNV